MPQVALANGMLLMSVGNVSCSRQPVSIAQFGWRTRNSALGLTFWCFSIKVLFTRDAMPEVGSMCPTCAFRAPMQTFSSLSVSARSTACTSIGSPSGVPEPCASTTCGCCPKVCHAVRRSINCEAALGAVRLALLPAHLVTLHTTRAARLAAALVRSELLTTAATQPSDATKPEAR